MSFKEWKGKFVKSPEGLVIYDLLFSIWVGFIVYLIIAPGGHYLFGIDARTINNIGLFTAIGCFLIMCAFLCHKHKWAIDVEEEDGEQKTD